VEAGVEAGRLVVKDAKHNKLYNLFFTANKPDVGSAIEFAGGFTETSTVQL
jgi:hypothetical protein